MKIQQSQMLLIEALLDGELSGQELLTAMTVLNTSEDLKLLYERLKEQKEAIKIAFLQVQSRH